MCVTEIQYVYVYMCICIFLYLHIFLLTPVILDKFICKTRIQQDSINQICIT